MDGSTLSFVLCLGACVLMYLLHRGHGGHEERRGDLRQGDGHEARGGRAGISPEDIRRRRALANGGRPWKGGCH